MARAAARQRREGKIHRGALHGATTAPLSSETAAQAGLSVGAFLRALALGSAGPRAVKRPRVEREQLARLLGEIGKLGSNVNQIARWANTDQARAERGGAGADARRTSRRCGRR